MPLRCITPMLLACLLSACEGPAREPSRPEATAAVENYFRLQAVSTQRPHDSDVRDARGRRQILAGVLARSPADSVVVSDVLLTACESTLNATVCRVSYRLNGNLQFGARARFWIGTNNQWHARIEPDAISH